MRGVLLMAVVVVMGCDRAPRFDATSQATVARSIEAMTAPLDDAGKRELIGAFLRIAAADVVRDALEDTFAEAVGGEKAAPSDATKAAREAKAMARFRVYHGMTADEMIAKEKAARAASEGAR